MRKYLFLTTLAVAVYSLLAGSCASSDCGAQCDSMQAIIEEYVQRDSVKSKLLEEYDTHLSAFGNIQDSIDMYQSSIDSLKSVIKQKGRASGSQSQELQKYMAMIRGLISKNEDLAAELKDAGYNNASMDRLIKMMYSSIEDKQMKLQQSQKEIAELKTKVQGLQTQVDDLTTENSSLNSTVSNLSKKVSRITGSVKVVQPKERKAKKIQQLSIVYTLKANPDAPTGRVNVYFRITDQNGSILKNPEGEFMYDGKSIAYSLKSTAEYDGQTVSQSVTWKKTTQNLEPGKYVVDMYIEDAKDSQDSFVLDK